MTVKYCGPALDYSGYGEANRHDIGALTAAGVGVVGEYTKHCLEIAEFGELGKLAIECSQRNEPYDIKILHTTPNIYGRFIEPGKYHIGRVFWETDRLPQDFARGVAMVDEIWTGSEFNANAIRKAGITDKPIFIIPEAIKADDEIPQGYQTANATDYKFYSVFEWSERKNPRALIEAFWREFEGDPSVSLTLKTYVDNFTPEKRQYVRDKFMALKQQLQLKEYAPVYLYTQLLNRSEMYRLHRTFDCYVSAHRGEGWGIPQMEAMLMERLVISTGCGGIHEHVADVAKILPYIMVQLKGVDKNDLWYTPDQNWAEVSIDELRKQMRWAYENQKQAKEMGQRSRQAVIDRFGLPVVGEKMRQRLDEIERQLTN